MSEEEKIIEEIKSEISQLNEENKGGVLIPLKHFRIILNYIDKLQKKNEELSQSNFQFLEINQKLIEEKPIIKELTGKELNLLEKIDTLQKQNKELKEEIEFQKNQRKLWRDNYYQQIDQIYNEKELINKEAEIMRDNTIKIFTAQDIIKAKFQVIDKLLGDSNE